MAAMPSIKWRLQIPREGGTKDWSTKMHFNGGFPANLSAATDLIVNMMADFKQGLREDVQVVDAVFYEDDTSPSVFTVPVATFGEILKSAGDPQAAIICALISWTTDARNSRGGPIYLRNFLHGAVCLGTDLEQLLALQKSKLQAFAGQFDDSGAGYSDGTNTYHRAGPDGVAGLVGTCELFVSRRVMARRG
jgi:hypothetical protein